MRLKAFDTRRSYDLERRSGWQRRSVRLVQSSYRWSDTHYCGTVRREHKCPQMILEIIFLGTVFIWLNHKGANDRQVPFTGVHFGW